jgi:hypothetical protein
MPLPATAIVAALAMLFVMTSVSASPAQPLEERCVGPRDGQDLATTAIRVVAAKRESFLEAVRNYGRSRSLGVGGATDNKGWIVVLLESRPYGVTIEVEAVDANTFHAYARTCNAAEDWRPYWTEFVKFVDAHRAEWRE